MSKNIEQVVNKILQAKNFSSPPIDAEKLAEFHFGLDFDCRPLEDTNTLAELSVAQKTIYINEARADALKLNSMAQRFRVSRQARIFGCKCDCKNLTVNSMYNRAEMIAIFLKHLQRII